MTYRKETQETLEALRNQGYKWTIETPVGYNVELFNEVIKWNGKTDIRFVAEVDSYGNIVEWGDYDEKDTRPRVNAVINADGEMIQ